MAEYFTLTSLLEAGGITLLFLLICFLVALIIIIERSIYFKGKSEAAESLLDDMDEALRTGNLTEGREILESHNTPVAYVLEECLELEGENYDEGLFEEVKGRAIAQKIPEMERYLNVVATLGTISPFIGLLGTVMGIIRSFQSLQGGQTAQGLAGLNAGIAEALVATAAGLFVAIPATIAYNYFRKRVSALIREAEIAASLLKVRFAKARRVSSGAV